MCSDDGKISDGSDLYVEHYNIKPKMEIRHNEIVLKLKEELIL